MTDSKMKEQKMKNARNVVTGAIILSLLSSTQPVRADDKDETAAELCSAFHSGDPMGEATCNLGWNLSKYGYGTTRGEHVNPSVRQQYNYDGKIINVY